MKDDSNRSLRRVNRKSRSAADRTVEVDSSAFFAEDPSPRRRPGKSPVLLPRAAAVQRYRLPPLHPRNSARSC